jgi:hypothetical protein
MTNLRRFYYLTSGSGLVYSQILDETWPPDQIPEVQDKNSHFRG